MPEYNSRRRASAERIPTNEVSTDLRHALVA
jgi:hypothetical protein